MVNAIVLLKVERDKVNDQMTIKKLQHLDEIEHLANRTPRPFIFGISDRGSIERLG